MREVEVVIPYTPRPLQLQIHNSLRRFNVLVCHRRFGKTVLAINEIIKQAAHNRLDAPRYAYIAPLYKQAKAVAWDYLKKYTAPIPGATWNESELRCDLPGDVRITLLGADNPDALRGIYLDGVVLDERAQMRPRLFSEVIRPALADRQGWAIDIGTPQGMNEFYEAYESARSKMQDGDTNYYAALFKASQTGVIPASELRLAREAMSEEQYDQEFECSFSAAISGSYYGKLMAAAESENRIGNIPYEPGLPVSTFWDLGVSDSTVIWFIQSVGKEVRVIDLYECHGEGLAHYAKVLQQKPYVYGTHYAPHDIEVRELGSGKSRKEVAQSLGLNFQVVPNISIADGIEAARNLLPRCWFDRTKCARGIEALKQYRKEWDDRMSCFRDRPLHDWTSHFADAFRYLAVGYTGPQRKAESIKYDTRWIV